MTYGDVSGELRESMSWLLQRYRTTHLIGNDQGERRAAGEAMLRYRSAVTTWCLQAVTTATPCRDLSGTTINTRSPVEELRFRLRRAVDAGPRELRLPELLGTQHTSRYVTVWQSAARAAVMGERELATAVSWAHRPAEQSTVVLKDACDIVRAIGVLEPRYNNVPGWQSLPQARRLVRAAEQVSAETGAKPSDHSVDQLGWRPTPGLIEGPALPGLAGVAQAQHNVAVELGHFPSALNLRRVMLSQAHLSREAARIAGGVEPSLAATFHDRANLYANLTRAGRDLGGLIGSGTGAATESANAADRATHIRGIDVGKPDSLHRLARLCDTVDARVGGSIERGLAEKLYFVSVQLPRLDQTHGGVHRARQKWVPGDSPVQAPILDLVRTRLRPPPGLPAATGQQSQTARAAYDALVQQQTARIGHARRR